MNEKETILSLKKGDYVEIYVNGFNASGFKIEKDCELRRGRNE